MKQQLNVSEFFCFVCLPVFILFKTDELTTLLILRVFVSLDAQVSVSKIKCSYYDMRPEVI